MSAIILLITGSLGDGSSFTGTFFKRVLLMSFAALYVVAVLRVVNAYWPKCSGKPADMLRQTRASCLWPSGRIRLACRVLLTHRTENETKSSERQPPWGFTLLLRKYRSAASPASLRAVMVTLCTFLAACSTTPPDNISNGCEIFRDKGDWYDDARDSFERWGVPIHVQLAIIHQESRFQHDAETEMEYFLWIVPVGRKSSAYGYAQVKDETWDWYRENTRNWGADRDDFADAVDFIGWYGKMTYDRLKVSKWDAKNQYLAYHEGHGGFRRKSYEQKPWLKKVAYQVEANARRYRAQLAGCRDELESGWWFW